MRDMTADETKLMQQHAAYWREWLERGHVVAFGPVADAAGGFGMGILELPDAADPQEFTRGDPVIRANAGFRYDVSPMPRLVARTVAAATPPAPPVPPPTTTTLTPEEQMAAFEKDLKENDWGHQPC